MLIGIAVATAKNALEPAILIGAVIGLGATSAGVFPRRIVLRALMVVGTSSVSFAYLAYSRLDQRLYELVAGGAGSLGAVLVILIIIWLSRVTMLSPPAERPGIAGALGFSLGVAVFGRVVSLALMPSAFFSSGTGLINSEALLKLAVFLGTLALSIILGTMVAAMASRLKPGWAAAWMALVAILLLSRHLITTAQMLVVTGTIVVAPSTFGLLAALINSRSLLLNLTLGAVIILAVPLWGNLKRSRVSAEGRNPAQQRLARARRRRDQSIAAGLLIASSLAGLLLASETVLAQKEVRLDPAVSVDIEKGQVRLALKTIDDRRLHRFSVDTDSGKKRFIVIHKGSGVYGVALDACENCGQVGYYTKGPNLVCKNCEAYINVATLGLPGGCNPIPIRTNVTGGFLVIDEKNFTPAKGDG